jgi:asparagine synthase (glutamine-hydrolysing)
MCGICGIIDKFGALATEQRIRAMNDLAAHRGPDGEGIRIRPGIAMGHRRLAILDLNPRGAQPMSWNGRYWIVYNGEVYNYREIRLDLEKLGYQFQTTTDTEVILAAYSEWGPACLSRFNGMWAFAIHDELEQTVFLARDRFGVKPLHLVETEREIGFASEIRQLLPMLPRVRANKAIVTEWLLTSFEGHRAETMFQGVNKLPAGHWMRISLRDNARETRRWYELKVNNSYDGVPIAQGARQFRELLTDSIKLRMRSDVRVGTCLSGGLDSSATSTIASEIYRAETGARFIGVHARSIESKQDESAFANLVANNADIDITTVTPSTEDFRQTIDAVVRTQEEPFGSPSMFMGWHVFQEARARGCPVMLNGQGGDEVLLGYERYFASYLYGQSPVKKIWMALRQARNSRLSLLTVLKYGEYFSRPALRIRHLVDRTFLTRESVNASSTEFVYRAAEAFRTVSEMQRFEIEFALPHLLRYEDRNSMAHSIETRLPFLDFRVVEAGVSMPREYKLHDGWTKYVLRRSMDDVLPSAVTWRRDKVGFEAPAATWLRSIRSQMQDELRGSQILAAITDHRRLLDDFASASLTQQWAYFNLAVWERIFCVSWD